MLGAALWEPPNEEAAAQFQTFSEQYPASYFVEREAIAGTTGRISLSGGDLAELINEHKRLRIPASFTRIGDGEGNLAALNGIGDIGAALADYCTRRISYIHFGDHNVISGDLPFFKGMIEDAINDADILGIPDPAAIINGFNTPDENKDVRGLVGNRIGYLAATAKSPKRFVSAWFNRDLLPHYTSILYGERKVTIITAYSELPPLMQKVFRFENVQHIPVPLQAVFIPTRQRQDTGHFPCAMKRILSAIKPSYQGQLFIVAAGLLSKRYCSVIKERGGIALDIGSIAEVWLGKQARSMPQSFIDRWKLPGDV